VESRTSRCAATNVEPGSGRRNMDIPRTLDEHYGHCDFGVYLVATVDGTLAIGDRVLRPG